MMHALRFLILLGIANIGFESFLYSQETVYLNTDWQIVTNPKLAKYKRILQKEGNGWHVEDYYHPANTLQMKGVLSSLAPDVLEGPIVFYYENGNIEKQGSYVGGRRVGVQKEYFESGQIKSEIDYRSEGLYFIQIWNEKGEPRLNEGTGSYQDINSDGNTQFVFIEDHQIVKNYTIRKQRQDTIYSVVEVLPEYRGGWRSSIEPSKNSSSTLNQPDEWVLKE